VDARAALVARYDFPLDGFQVRALDALDAGRSVLVAAPTGSGKTVVAEYAVELALHGGGKAFYTSPIKALSNQKFGDLARVHGADSVGLLTGDNSINGDASAVVMTTEVLRNMIYARSPTLEGLRYVVLDEVHYLQDAYRGPVWEEVIIHLPPEVRLVCLSATVSNAEELADWITTVRGPTQVIIEDRRPVELRDLYLVGDKHSERLHLLPTLVDGRPNPEAARLDEEVLHGRGPRGGPRGRPRRRFFTPRRVEVIERLDEEGMLPAIVFVFSRMGCDEARDACLQTGLRLTTNAERARVRAIVDERTAVLADADLDLLGFDRFLAGLEAGIAAHHAGMVPPFKEAVEACFAEGLTKVVFATETLALGVNMPARSVVIERLTKFGGERREFLTPGEYTQLTGRAGRRGIDELGNAIVLWSPFVPFEQVASLAASRTYALRSAFRPTYNMAANLVRRHDPEEAHRLLRLSFAQFQADRAVVRIESRVERRRSRIAELRGRARCERGDVEEYRRLRDQAQRSRRAVRAAVGSRIEDTVSRLVPGDVVVLDGARHAVISVAWRKGGPRLMAVDERARVRTYSVADLDRPVEAVGTVEVPVPFTPNNRGFQRELADRLRRARIARSRRGAEREGDDEAGGRGRRGDDPDLAADLHPVADCPDLDAHLRALTQAERAEREVAELERQVSGRTGSLVRHFDRVLRLLEAWGHLDGWALTDSGEVLARTYHEADLLVAEALTTGLFDDLDAAEVASLASCLAYEHRGRDAPPPPSFPSTRVRARFRELERLWGELAADEEAAGLPATRAPDPGFAAIAHAWAAGGGLAAVLSGEELSGGDFVRTVKQLLDLLGQIGDIAPEGPTRAAARRAAEAVHRGVVAASSVVEAAEGDGPGEVPQAAAVAGTDVPVAPEDAGAGPPG
jgi:ATP-dependent RNA helicase HelY